MGEPGRILLVEDHAMIREAIRSILSSQDDFLVVGEAEDGEGALKCVSELSPDLVLMDLSLPRTNSRETIREVKRRRPDIRILVLTAHDDEKYVFDSLQEGVEGYMLKEECISELQTAITSILAGKRYFSPSILERLVNAYLERTPIQEKEPQQKLTMRERELLKLIVGGYNNTRISTHMGISPRTVEKHKANMMKKLAVHSTSSLIAVAWKERLISK